MKYMKNLLDIFQQEEDVRHKKIPENLRMM